MKFFWKLFLAFFLPLLFALGSFYLSKLVKRVQNNSESGLSFDFPDAGLDFLSLPDWFNVVGISLIFLSVLLPTLILKRETETPAEKLIDDISILKK
jgi:hypothetical protein